MSFGGVSDLVFDEEGFFGHTRAIERLSLMFKDIGYGGGDNNENNTGDLVSGDGGGIPEGFGIVTIQVCVGGALKNLDVIGRGPY
jgi:hypothetical protein